MLQEHSQTKRFNIQRKKKKTDNKMYKRRGLRQR